MDHLIIALAHALPWVYKTLELVTTGGVGEI